jgi:broad specificity phosphatase PhoE
MITTIYLLRHGATPANLEDRFAGRSGEPLHPEGEAQIRRLEADLHHLAISHLYCGPLPRTMQSAEILRAMLDIPVTPEPGLNEIHIPHWDGLSKARIRDLFGKQYPTWLQTPHHFQVEGCETVRDVQERARRAVERIMSAHAGKAVLLISHLIVLRALLLYYQGMEISEFRSIKVGNGEIFSLTRNGAGEVAVRKIDRSPMG